MIIDIDLFRTCLQHQNYSESSIRSYLTCMQQFLDVFKTNGSKAVTIEFIEKHINWLIKEKEISKSYQKQILDSIQKYYDLVLNQKLDLTSIYPKNVEYNLPNCLSKDDIKAMIDSTENLKHKTIICLLYSGGLRLSEILNLTLSNIDTLNKVIHIYQTKFAKERDVMLSSTLLEMLPAYYEKYKPKHFVIEGQKGMAYSQKSVQQVVKLSAKRAGIKIKVTPQCLRHTFALHLLDNGTDIHQLQELLGHQSIKSTENYTHVSDTLKSNIKSPLDSL